MAVKDNIKSALKINRRTFINPRAWLDYDMVKAETQTVIGITRDVFTPEAPPVREETFEEATQRLQLSEEDVKNISLNFLSFAAFFLLAGFVMIGFGIYMLINFFILGFLLSLALTSILFAQAFRYHFWYFQMKHRKLGCTFEEWRRGRTNEEGPSE